MRRRLSVAGLFVGVLLAVVGARWIVVNSSTMELPEWDQWDAEGLHLLLPWYRGDPVLPALFRPHNEHYVVLTKLLNLALTVANRGWNQRLEATVNAVLPGLLAATSFLWALRLCGQWSAIVLASFLAVLWGLPIAWENIISGFHSQQFFLITLAWATIALLPGRPIDSFKWWIGVGCAALSLLSMASGFFAAVVVVAIVLLRLLLRELTWRANWPTLAVGGAVALAGIATRHEVAYHAVLKAQTMADFCSAFIQALQWPADSAWAAVLLWCPWTALSMSLLSRRAARPSCNAGWTLCGLGAWVWLQAAATAYARGAGGPAPVSRYLDPLVFGASVNFLALLWLARQRVWRRRPLAVTTVALAWLAVFGAGAVRVAQHSITVDLPQTRSYHANATALTRVYLATGDRASLDSPDLPYPGADAYAERLAWPELAQLLPASVQPANGIRPLAAAAERIVAQGVWVTAAGFLLLAACSFVSLVLAPYSPGSARCGRCRL